MRMSIAIYLGNSTTVFALSFVQLYAKITKKSENNQFAGVIKHSLCMMKSWLINLMYNQKLHCKRFAS